MMTMQNAEHHAASPDAGRRVAAGVAGVVTCLGAGIFMPPLGLVLVLAAVAIFLVRWLRGRRGWDVTTSACAGVLVGALIYGSLVIVSQITGDPGSDHGSSQAASL